MTDIQRELTVIDIKICTCTFSNKDSSVAIDYGITSNTEFQKPIVYTLGFRSRKSETKIKRIGDRYTTGDLLETYQYAIVRVPPFMVNCTNLGDGLLGVNVRMKGGMTVCRLSILSSDGKKPKINDDDFLKSDDIWYAMAVIRSHQTVRIEELSRGDYDTQPLAQEGDSD